MQPPPPPKSARTKRVLISGCGIAGPALAHFLVRQGMQPVIVEQAPRLRTEGYIIDFWGEAYRLTERMGLLPEILDAGYRVEEVRLLGASGRKLGGFKVEVMRKATGGRFTSLQRGDLSAVLYRSIERDVEVRFGESIRAIEQTPAAVEVELASGTREVFDFVVGADGLHSQVRALAFGPEQRYERFLDYAVAAFTVDGYQPRDPGVYAAYAEPGRQVARFSMHDARTMFLLIVADPGARQVDPRDVQAHKAYLRQAFQGAAWEWPQICRALEQTPALYFDRMSQIELPAWSSGRVVLLGDAAFAPSLLAGQGSGLAIIGAYVLAGELASTSEYGCAFQRYEALLRPFIEHKQRSARSFAGSFAPRTRIGIIARALVTRTLSIPGMAKLAMGSTLKDEVELPDYPAPAKPAAHEPRPSAREGV